MNEAMDRSDTTRTRSHIELRSSDARQVFVDAESDRFFLPVQQAVLACQHQEAVREWNERFGTWSTEVKRTIQDWCQRNVDVMRAFLAFRPNDPGFVLLLITRGDRYPFDLDDPIASLDRALVDLQRSVELPVEVMAIPAVDEENRFSILPGQDVLELYANSE